LIDLRANANAKHKTQNAKHKTQNTKHKNGGRAIDH
jgi:hypothetical protein